MSTLDRHLSVSQHLATTACIDSWPITISATAQVVPAKRRRSFKYSCPNVSNRLDSLRTTAATRSLANDRLLNPELVHSDKRIRIVDLEACPVTQISAGRVIGKACAVLN
jgi:hypothetical protein